ncbi:MAG: hypothetical protein ACT4QF_16975 [Sporichthyaceae bacterium]
MSQPARERLSDRLFAAMWDGRIEADPSNHVLAASIAKENCRGLLGLSGCGERAG